MAKELPIAMQPISHVAKAAARQALIGDPTEKSAEDLAVQRAKTSLLGEPAVPQDKSPEELARKVRMQWIRNA
jgi:hypothetical protein